MNLLNKCDKRKEMRKENEALWGSRDTGYLNYEQSVRYLPGFQ